MLSEPAAIELKTPSLPEESFPPAERSGSRTASAEPSESQIRSPAGIAAGTVHEAEPSEPILRLTGIRKHYGDVVALDGVDLSLARGEFLAILGPSGSGKTTTLRIVGGFVAPDSGRIELSGRDVTALRANRRDVNTVFQSYALFPHMTVRDNVGYGLKVKRVSRAERNARISEALALVQLSHAGDRRPGELSGGMQQRVALARALVNRPSVLLLDEPLGALDRKLRDEMQLELREMQTQLGMTFMYVTHDQEEALGMSDRLVVMREGRIEQSGLPAAVYDNPATLWVAGFVGASNRLTGTVRELGELVRMECDFGSIVGAKPHGELRVGERATAVLRPEHVAITDERPTGDHNAVRVQIQEVLNVGSQLRCVAFTPGGLKLSVWQSRIDGRTSVHSGEEAWLSWSPEPVHVYPDRDERASQSPPS